MSEHYSDKQEQILEEILQEISDQEEKDIIIYNDDVNTFEHVIKTLVKVCKHNNHQAEQCAWIIHHKGKCSVKKGSLDELKPMKEAICEAGIDARII